MQVVGRPEPRGSSLPRHAAHPVTQRASAPTARHDNARSEGGTLRKNTISKERLVPNVSMPRGHAKRRLTGERGFATAAVPSEHDQEINRNKLERHRQQQRLHCTPGRARGLRSPQPGPACVRVTHSCCRTWRA